MTLSRVGNSVRVAVGSLHLFAWDTRSQENDFTASVRDGAGTCVSGDSAQNRRHSTGNSARALRASHAGRGRPSPPWRATAPTAPSPCIHETASQTPGLKDVSRATASGAGRNRRGRWGGSNKLRAVWTKPQTKCARTAGRSAGGCERVETFYCKFGVTQTRQHRSVGVGRHTCTGTISLTDRHIKSTPGDIPF